MLVSADPQRPDGGGLPPYGTGIGCSLRNAAKRHGRKGSLDNPEVYENVPGHVIPILEREFDDFDNEAEKFLAGNTAEDEFIKFRLRQGVYGQRQADVQMIRVKLPFGGITPEQMETFADVVERWAPLNKGHITTRQNIQLHHIPLRDAAEAIRVLGEADLSSREGCGNTVRNVTGDPWAGICEGELFDPTPYVGAYVRYFVRHPTTQMMPRKVKTAFTATDEDRAITGIHDVAYIPRIRDGVRGFEMRVGGGTSIMPRVAPTLSEFVRADDGEYLKWAEAVFRIFDRQDWLRVNRARARIKVFVDKFGIDELRSPGRGGAEGRLGRRARLRSAAAAVRRRRGGRRAAGARRLREPERRRQRSSSASASRTCAAAPGGLLHRPGQGDPRRPHARAVPRRSPRSCATTRAATARTTVHQNLVLRWVRDESVYDVWQRTHRAGPRRGRARTRSTTW